MAQIIKSASRKTITHHYLTFSIPAQPGCGYSFFCDAEGVLSVGSMTPEATANLALCLSGFTEKGEQIIAEGVKKYDYDVKDYALLKCDCGSNMLLIKAVNDCECGRLYNLFGQGLAPIEQWEESDYDY